MGRLDGKIAFITGTGGGQGRTAAQIFTSEGATVVGCDVSEEGAKETLDLVTAEGGKMFSVAPLDLSDPAGAAQWINEGIEAAGGIDILYNNAAAVRFSHLPSVSDEDWYFTIKNELDLVFFACRAAWPPC